MGRQRSSGISCTVQMRNMEPTKRQHNNWYGISALQKERQRAQERYDQNIQGLGPETLQTLAEIQGTASLPTNDADMATVNDFDSDDWEDIIPDAPEESLAHAARDMLDSR
ncbi:hypothetical protein C0992_002011, partial [Termitomyces sp. T32_za158]